MHAALSEHSTGLKWRAASAIPKNRGASAGVAIATKRHFPLGEAQQAVSLAMPGRLAASVLYGLAIGGVLLVSVYLTVGQSRADLAQELADVGSVLLRQSRPFIVGGDLN
eukprot:826567-Amphidinium_carterae.1